MTETSTETELLIVAVQDLHAGERAWQERLPALRDKAGRDVADFIAQEMRRAESQAATLATVAAQLDAKPEDAPNIWLNAVIDDAERDAETIVAGPLRDIALIGALRKGKQSERVSYETAIGLAEKLGHDDIAQRLTNIRDEEGAADTDLADLLRKKLA
jgi:ferritin-like metal-binding protein YciE